MRKLPYLAIAAAVLLTLPAQAQYLRAPEPAIVDNSIDASMQPSRGASQGMPQTIAQTMPQSMDVPSGSTMQQGQRYETVTGGVTGEERSMIDAEQRGKSVKLVYAATNGEYMADVQVSIKSTNGEEVSSFKTDGPYVFVALPKGSYTVTSTLDSQTRTQKIVAPASGQKAYTIRFSPQ